MKKITNILFCFMFFSQTLWAQTETNFMKQANQTEMNRWVDSVYNKMSVDEKIGQLFMPIAEPNNNWKGRINNYISYQKVGGLLFSGGTVAQQAEVTNYAQSISDIPLFIALDGEWGLSMRLTDAPKFPRNFLIGAIQDENIIQEYGKEVARQCRAMGIHINFAPVMDVNSNPRNPVIGTRSFGEDVQNVAKSGIAYSKGLEDGGVMAVAKHFPGHGDTSEDSHKTLPSITHNHDRLEKVELLPFKQYIEQGFSGMMVGHLNVPALQTNGLPSSLSPNVIQKLLKENMGFQGLVFTDGMAMKGVSTQPDMSVKALLAGNDIVLGVVNQAQEFNSVKNAVNKGVISASLLEEKVKKILAYKFILGAHKFRPINTSRIVSQLQTSETDWVQQKIYEGALTLLKNDQNTLPITELDKSKIASVSLGGASAEYKKQLKKYAEITYFDAPSMESLNALQSKLSGFDLIIFSIHSDKLADHAALQNITKSNQSVLLFFTSPNRLNNFKTSVANAKSVLLAYDNSPMAQKAAAQGVFGGIAISGKLPMGIGSFRVNTGIETKKNRLSYSFPEEVGISGTTLQSIDKIALEGIQKKAYPGCYVLVAKNGVVIYSKGFGKLDYNSQSAAVDDETVYDLASITKAAATLPAVMKLYDEKKLRLQDNIGKFVPEARGSNKAKISIRDALLHETGITSFIPYYTSAIDKNSFNGPLFGKKSALYHARYAGAWGRTDYKFIPALISSKSSETFHLPVAKDMYASDKMHQTLLQEVIATDLKSITYRYSCLNFMLLKEVVENVAKTDLQSYVKGNFFEKLGAETTTFQPLKYMSFNRIAPTENDPFFRKQQLRGYVHDEGAALFGGISGNAGLFSTADDLAKLCQMWLNHGEYGGERFLSSETVRLFTMTKSNNSRRGLGFDKPDMRNNNSSPTSPLTPITVYGHTGYTGTSFWIDPDNQMIYIFLSNRVYPERTPNRLASLKIRERIQDELYKAIGESQK